MEQQENPDNNNVVESKFEPLDHLRSAVRSRLRQLHVINIEQQAAYDAFRSPSEKSIEPQQASVIKSVPVKNTSPASTKDCKIAELQASESSSNAMTICNFPNEVMYKILKNLTFDGIAVNRSVSSAPLFVVFGLTICILSLGVPILWRCLQRHSE